MPRKTTWTAMCRYLFDLASMRPRPDATENMLNRRAAEAAEELLQ